MRLTKRAYAFLCRQYRLILQQNHFANAVCRGLVAGALGAGLTVGATGAMLGASFECAYAAVNTTPTLGSEASYSITSGVSTGDTNYLTTFTTTDAAGNAVTYGVKLNTATDSGTTVSGLMKDVGEKGLGTDYTLTYTQGLNPNSELTRYPKSKPRLIHRHQKWHARHDRKRVTL